MSLSSVWRAETGRRINKSSEEDLTIYLVLFFFNNGWLLASCHFAVSSNSVYRGETEKTSSTTTKKEVGLVFIYFFEKISIYVLG